VVIASANTGEDASQVDLGGHNDMNAMAFLDRLIQKGQKAGHKVHVKSKHASTANAMAFLDTLKVKGKDDKIQMLNAETIPTIHLVKAQEVDDKIQVVDFGEIHPKLPNDHLLKENEANERLSGREQFVVQTMLSKEAKRSAAEKKQDQIIRMPMLTEEMKEEKELLRAKRLANAELSERQASDNTVMANVQAIRLAGMQATQDIANNVHRMDVRTKEKETEEMKMDEKTALERVARDDAEIQTKVAKLGATDKVKRLKENVIGKNMLANIRQKRADVHKALLIASRKESDSYIAMKADAAVTDLLRNEKIRQRAGVEASEKSRSAVKQKAKEALSEVEKIIIPEQELRRRKVRAVEAADLQKKKQKIQNKIDQSKLAEKTVAEVAEREQEEMRAGFIEVHNREKARNRKDLKRREEVQQTIDHAHHNVEEAVYKVRMTETLKKKHFDEKQRIRSDKRQRNERMEAEAVKEYNHNKANQIKLGEAVAAELKSVNKQIRSQLLLKSEKHRIHEVKEDEMAYKNYKKYFSDEDKVSEKMVAEVRDDTEEANQSLGETLFDEDSDARRLRLKEEAATKASADAADKLLAVKTSRESKNLPSKDLAKLEWSVVTQHPSKAADVESFLRGLGDSAWQLS